MAYIAVAVLLLGLNLYSTWSAWVKSLVTLIVASFFWTVYHAWPGVQGWPTAHGLPQQFFLYAVNVAEPDSIYLWGSEFEQGLGQTVPRAYSLPYTPKLHDKVDKASRKLRKGLPVIGQLITSSGTNVDLTQLEQINIADQDLVFIDAPQALIPGKN